MNTGGVFELNGKNETVTLVWNGGTLRNSSTSSPSTVTTTAAGYVLNGNGNIEAVAGATITLTNNNPGHGNNFTLSTTGPGTVTLDGSGDNAATPVIVHSGTLILAKFSSGAAHATNTINGVDAGATVQLAGTGGDQIYNGFPGFNFGVFNMNGTFDFNGNSEAWDKLTGSGNVINSVPANNVTMTLGTNNGDGNTVADFSGTIQGNISVVKTGTGTQTLSGNNTYIGTTDIQGGTLVVTKTYTTGTGTTVGSNTTLRLPHSIATPGNVVYKAPLTISGNVDIGDNKLIAVGGTVGSWNGSAYTDLSGLIQAGRTTSSNWSGSGIVTSQTSATNGSNFTSIGVATGAQVVPSSATATALWAGQTITGTDALVMYTYGGDANLDGKINIDDYGHIDTSIGIGLTGWFNGDFNYDGVINIDDYGIIDVNIGIQGAPFPTAAAAATPGAAGLSGVAAVPEPASLGVLATGALGLLLRRRRRTR
jgi:autotransporter-associated beta strand protein